MAALCSSEVIRSTPSLRPFWVCTHTEPLHLSQPLPLSLSRTLCCPARFPSVQSHGLRPFPCALAPPPGIPLSCLLSSFKRSFSCLCLEFSQAPLGWVDSPQHFEQKHTPSIHLQQRFFNLSLMGLTLSRVVVLFNLLLPRWVVNSFQTLAMPY